MPNQEQKKAGELQAKQLVDLKLKYAELVKNPAMIDIIDTLTQSYEAAHQAALNEIDNPTRAVAALQQANAYARIRSYILDMMV